MKNIFCLLFIFLSFFTASAQYLQDLNGRPYFTTKYREYEGSPFLFDDWKMANIVTAKGKRIEKIMVNVDLYGNTFLFNRNDTFYMFAEEIKEFNINEGLTSYFFKKGKAIDAQLPDIFMQVVSTNPLVARQVTKQLVETQGYGTATKINKFIPGYVYYGEIDGSIKKFKLTKADAQKFFYRKWDQVQAYASSNNLSYKTDAGWMQLLSYYQSLQ